MSSLSKILTIAGLAGVGYFAYTKFKSFSNFADSLRVYVTDLGVRLKDGHFSVLFKVNMDNPSDMAIPIDQIFVTIFKKEANGQWTYIANSSPQLKQFVLKAWDTTKLSHSVRMPTMDAIKEAFSLIQAQKEIKVNIKIHALGQIVEIDSLHTV
jgi:hypothetical protein